MVKDIAVGAGGLGLRAGQIGHSVDNDSPPLGCFLAGETALP